MNTAGYPGSGRPASVNAVPRLVGEGWPRLAEVAPVAAAIVTPLAL
jgi:hypothetical protein